MQLVTHLFGSIGNYEAERLFHVIDVRTIQVVRYEVIALIKLISYCPLMGLGDVLYLVVDD